MLPITKKLGFFFLLFWAHQLTAQLTITITEYPSNTPIGDTLFLVGNFNDWLPGDLNYQFSRTDNNSYEITFAPDPGSLAFKVTRGNWDKVETNENGGFQPDHTYNYTGGKQMLELTIGGWEDLNSNNTSSTAANNVRILKEDFFIPQLNRSRRISIYLPPDYDQSEKAYPVLYVQDGQNVFDDARSSFGEWQIDESLNALHANGDYGVIVVAIDHGDSKRIDEYSPYQNAEYGGGEGVQYADFIANTLKPYVDENFRTLPSRENTGILGSSMGGLIAQYTAIQYQEIFGKAGVLSPSFWFSDKIYQHVLDQGKRADMRVYYLGGEKESSSLIGQLQGMQATMDQAGFKKEMETILVTHADGQHSEWYWRREFPNAYQWLFGDGPVLTNTDDQPENQNIRLYPNPTQDSLIIDGLPENEEFELRIFSIMGAYLWSRELDANSISIQSLRPGTYLFQVGDSKGNALVRERIVILE